MKTLLATLACLALCACSGGGGGGAAPATGSLELSVTDAPFAHDVVRAARIAVRAVRIHREADGDSGFLTLYEGAPIELDLLELQNGVSRGLVRSDLPVGAYRQLRLVLAGAELELTNGNVYRTSDGTLRLTSQDTSGFKLFLDPPLEIVTESARRLLLDFDLTKTFLPIPANDALSATRYQLRPTVKVSNLAETGEIRGTVRADDGTGQLAGVGGATVYLLAPGELDPANALTTTGTRASGSFALIGVEPGTYDLRAVQGALAGRLDGVQVFAANATVVDLVLQ